MGTAQAPSSPERTALASTRGVPPSHARSVATGVTATRAAATFAGNAAFVLAVACACSAAMSPDRSVAAGNHDYGRERGEYGYEYEYGGVAAVNEPQAWVVVPDLIGQAAAGRFTLRRV